MTKEKSEEGKSQSCICKAHERPLDEWHDAYQRYYQAGLRELLGSRYCPVRTGLVPPLLRFAREVRHSSTGAAVRRKFPKLYDLGEKLLPHLEGPLRSPSRGFDPLVGEYVFTFGSREVRVALDAHDAGRVQSERLRSWAHIYFKTNYWEDVSYPSNVLPMMNGSALVTKHEALLRSLRSTPKEYDISCVMRVWGGEDEVSGIEHNVRILEEAAAFRGKKRVIAYLVAGDIPRLAKRLEAAGIECITRPLSPEELWRICAASKFVVLRLGMHGCVPWRMADMLAIGAAVIFDRAPFTRWHSPLKENEHFLSLDIPFTVTNPVAPSEAYEGLTEKIEGFVKRAGLAESLARSAAKYFDEHGSPLKVAEHIVERAGSV